MDTDIKNGRFKKTRQLVRFAKNDDMTQSEIAKVCGVEQSTVSNWENGKLKATEQQVHPLLELYGHKLGRKASKVYWSPWSEATGFSELHRTHIEDLGEMVTSMGRSSAPQSAFTRYFYRIEGPVILSFTCVGFSEHSKERVAVKKLVVHHQGNESFRLVELSRLFETSDTRGENYLRTVPPSERPWVLDIIHDPVGIVDLLEQLDRYADQWISNHIDAFNLPMKARKALIDNGFTVSEVDDYPALGGKVQ